MPPSFPPPQRVRERVKKLGPSQPEALFSQLQGGEGGI